jgi:methenyltetrahydromethanopterin cyclohydrolase
MNSMEQKMWDRLLEEKAELVAEIKQLREVVKVVEDAVKTHIAWEAGASETFVAWSEFAWELHDMLYGGEEE